MLLLLQPAEHHLLARHAQQHALVLLRCVLMEQKGRVLQHEAKTCLPQQQHAADLQQAPHR